MKIIEPGDLEELKKVKRFKCVHCGCVFEADSTEYSYDHTEPYTVIKVVCPFCNRETISI